MLPAEHADALRFHVSVRQRDESLAEARRVPLAHPRVGDRGRPQGGGLQRVRADDSPGRPGAGEDGRGIRVFARRRAFTESGRSILPAFEITASITTAPCVRAARAIAGYTG